MGMVQKRRLWGDLTMAFQHLKESYKKDGDRLFVGSVVNRTSINGYQLKDGRFRLDIKKKYFIMRIVKD